MIKTIIHKTRTVRPSMSFSGLAVTKKRSTLTPRPTPRTDRIPPKRRRNIGEVKRRRTKVWLRKGPPPDDCKTIIHSPPQKGLGLARYFNSVDPGRTYDFNSIYDSIRRRVPYYHLRSRVNTYSSSLIKRHSGEGMSPENAPACSDDSPSSNWPLNVRCPHRPFI